MTWYIPPTVSPLAILGMILPLLYKKISKLIVKSSLSPFSELSSTSETILVAVTTAGEGMINQHFGSVKEFLIYEAGDQGIRFIQHRKTEYEYCAGPDGGNPIAPIIEKLKDCKLILTAKIGECPQNDLKAAGLVADQSYAFQPIEASVLKATRKYFGLEEELEEAQVN